MNALAARDAPEPCARCNARPATNILWPLCKPCWLEQCAEKRDAPEALDAVGLLMLDEGISFPDAVERIARERGLL